MVKNMEKDFWDFLEELVQSKKKIIDRPKGSNHPRIPEIIYPVDYGYLEDTSSMDGGGIDIWVGSDIKQKINGIICTIDALKSDSEIKILIGCNILEIETIISFHNEKYMRGIFIRNERNY